MSESTFLLVDGLAGAYRFYYAIRGLTTKTGTPTNALFGFVRMMQQLAKAWQPTHWAVVFDGGSPALRLNLVPGYKANRKPMPDELRAQLPLLNEYLEKAGVFSIRRDACEADDIIATLARQAAEAGSDVLIATADKDLFQLVDERIRIVSLAGEPVDMKVEDVVNRTGVLPQQIPGWLALTGDNADNVPGVPGVGPKTAAKLLSDFGNLDSLYAGLGSVENTRIRNLLDANREVVARNLKVVTLDCGVADVSGWESMKRQNAPIKPLLDFYRKYELHAFANSLTSPELF